MLSAETHTAGVRIIWWAGWYGHNTDAICGDLVLRRSRRNLGCSSSASKGEDDNDESDDMFHSEIPLKLYLKKKIFLDNPDEVTIG